MANHAIDSSANVHARISCPTRQERATSSNQKRMFANWILTLMLTTVLLQSVLVSRAQTTDLSLNPARLQAQQIDQVFTINLTVNDVQDLWAWKASIAWDPQVIRLAADPIEGDFLRSAGSTVFLFTPPQQNCLPEVSCVLLTQGGQDGSGVLATLTFRIVKESVESELAISSSTLLAAAPAGSPHEEITHTTSVCVVSLVIGEKPVAKAEVNESNPVEDTFVVFDGSKSIPVGENLSYTWSFFDGAPKILAGAIVQYVFQKPGNYSVTLTIEDQRGETANDTITVFVRDVTPPEAIIAIENVNASQTIEVGQTLTFNASNSFDPESGSIKAYQWDLGDGTTSPSPIVNHRYEDDGEYTVRLTVFDARAGNNATATTMINVGSYSQQSFRLPILVTGMLTVVTATVLIGSVFWLQKRP